MKRLRLAVVLVLCLSLPFAGAAAGLAQVGAGAGHGAHAGQAPQARDALMAERCSMDMGDDTGVSPAPPEKCRNCRSGVHCGSCLFAPSLPSAGTMLRIAAESDRAPANARTLALQGEPARLWRPPRHPGVLPS